MWIRSSAIREDKAIQDTHDALYDSKKIRHILSRHEQGSAHEADGYARATGKTGVVIVTSGPGATNTVTGIATAYMDSVPMVVITGQVPRSIIGTDAFQESDIVGITMPVVKHSYLLQDINELTNTFREAFYIANSGRPGPVLIDVPSDLCGMEVEFNYPADVHIPSYKPTVKGNARQIRQAVDMMKEAKRPVLYIGGGIIASNSEEELLSVAEALQIRWSPRSWQKAHSRHPTAQPWARGHAWFVLCESCCAECRPAHRHRFALL